MLIRLKHNQHTAPEKISHLISIKNLVIKINKTYEVHDSNGREFLIISLSLSLKKKWTRLWIVQEIKLTNENNETKEWGVNRD